MDPNNPGSYGVCTIGNPLTPSVMSAMPYLYLPFFPAQSIHSVVCSQAGVMAYKEEDT